MTQPHYIDPVSVALFDMREIANGLGYESILEALEDLERLKSARETPMEAVAWREKLADAAYVVLRHSDYRPGTDNGLIPHDDRLVPLAIADVILALIYTHPVQGGEGRD